MRANSREKLSILLGFSAIYLIWGSTYLALAVALHDIPPFALMGTRSLVGGLILLAYSKARPQANGPAKSWLRATICGVLFFLGCHGVLAYAEQRVPSGLAAVMLATIPFWIIAGRSMLGRTDLPLARTLLLMLPGVAGVLLVAWRSIEGPAALHLSDILLLMMASASWALGTIIAEGNGNEDSSVAFSGKELVAGGAALLLFSACRGEMIPAISDISLLPLLGWGYLTLAGTVVAFGSYIWLLRKVPPTLVATYTFVNPVIAVLLGSTLLGEPITVATVIGGLLVLASVAGLLLANRKFDQKETSSHDRRNAGQEDNDWRRRASLGKSRQARA